MREMSPGRSLYKRPRANYQDLGMVVVGMGDKTSERTNK